MVQLHSNPFANQKKTRPEALSVFPDHTDGQAKAKWESGFPSSYLRVSPIYHPLVSGASSDRLQVRRCIHLPTHQGQHCQGTEAEGGGTRPLRGAGKAWEQQEGQKSHHTPPFTWLHMHGCLHTPSQSQMMKTISSECLYGAHWSEQDLFRVFSIKQRVDDSSDLCQQ